MFEHTFTVIYEVPIPFQILYGQQRWLSKEIDKNDSKCCYQLRVSQGNAFIHEMLK